MGIAVNFKVHYQVKVVVKFLDWTVNVVFELGEAENGNLILRLFPGQLTDVFGFIYDMLATS